MRQAGGMDTVNDTLSRASGHPPRWLARLYWFRGGLLILVLAELLGCRTARDFGKPDCKYDLLVAELRTREQEILEARAELHQLRMLTGMPARAGEPSWPGAADLHCPPMAAGGLGVRAITLAPGTGGVDDDLQPGDEAFMVVVVPRDGEGTAVKAPGILRVAAYDVTPEGLKHPIGRWEVSPDQLRKAWRSGLFSSGYFVPLQWDQPPANGRVRIVARLTTLDGREFESDKEVSVRPMISVPPAGGTHGPPMATPPPPAPSVPTPTGPMIPPPEVPELPPPAGLRGTSTSQPTIELPPPAATLGGVRAIP
jgi:hypothetical protein